MHFNDRIIGLLALMGGIAIFAGTADLRVVPGQQFGAAFFPRLVGGAMILTGIAFFVKGQAGPLWRVPDMLRGVAGLRVAAVLIAIIGWVVISPVLGFIATTALLIAALTLLAGGRALPAVASGLGMALVLYVIFGLLLRVPLPLSAIERMLS